MDVLKIFKDCLANKQPTYLDGNDIILGDLQLNKDSLCTQFKDKTLTLGQVWFFIRCQALGLIQLSQYIPECKKTGFQPVPITEKASILKLLLPEGLKNLKPTTFENPKEKIEEKQEKEVVDIKNLEQIKKSFEDYIDNFPPPLPATSKESTVTTISNGSQKQSTLDIQSFLPYIEKDYMDLSQKIRKREIPPDFIQNSSSFSSRSSDASSTDGISRKLSGNKKPRVTLINGSSSGSSDGGVNTVNPLALFEDVPDLVERIQKEEEQRKIAEEKREKEMKLENITHKSKGKYDEKLGWQHALEGTEHETLGIDMKGSLLGSTSATAAEDLQQDLRNSKTQQHIHSKILSKFKRLPIILIPSSESSPLTMFNIKEFLEKEKFVFSEQAMENMKPTNWKGTILMKPGQLIIRRKVRNVEYEFIVMDEPMGKLQTKEDWDRVVAIFTNGQSWQFKGWPLRSPAEIFAKYKGFYVKFDDETIKENAKQWAVQICTVNKGENKRHLDHMIVSDIWKTIIPN